MFSSFYQVDPEEVGVVTRFGKFVDTTNPGLHFKLPFGVDRVFKVPVQRQLKQEFGFRTVRAGVRSEFRGAPGESNMLTPDSNRKPTMATAATDSLCQSDRGRTGRISENGRTPRTAAVRRSRLG